MTPASILMKILDLFRTSSRDHLRIGSNSGAKPEGMIMLVVKLGGQARRTFGPGGMNVFTDHWSCSKYETFMPELRELRPPFVASRGLIFEF